MNETGKTPETQAKRNAWIPLAFLLGAIACIAGRILAFPIKRDEHMFLTVAQQFHNGDLYRDLGYNHLPNLAMLFSAIFDLTGTEHYLLTARLIVVVAWALALLLLWRIGVRLGISTLAIVTGMALLVGNVTLVGPPGANATNSFLPIPFAFLAFFLMLGVLDPARSGRQRFVEAFLAGLAVSIAIGFKANFIILAPCFFLVSLLAPKVQTLVERVKLQCLPLALGGLVGGLPSILYFIRDPEAMIAHTLRYFTVLHTAFWSDSPEPKVMSLAGKMLLAEEQWVGGTTLLAAVGIGLLALRPYRDGGWSDVIQNLLHWPVLLAASLVACGVLISFVPSPSFLQYFVPPMPFVILTFLALCPEAKPSRHADFAILIPLLAIALLASSVRMVPGLAALAGPANWTGIASNQVMHDVLDGSGVAPDARIATMSPILAIEGGRRVYPEFVAGQFVYRVAPYMSDEERQYYRTTAPGELDAFLDANRPDAILVDTSEPMESVFADYARTRNFREVPVDRTINGLEFRLFLPAAPLRASDGPG